MPVSVKVKLVLLPLQILVDPERLPVGKMRLVSTTSSVLGVHTPLLTVQRNVTLFPAVNPLTALLLAAGVVMLAPFAAPTIVHAPLPAAGMFPASVKFPLLHCSWSAPAAEVVGTASTVIVNDCGLPLHMP